MPNTGGGNDLTIDKLMLEVASDSAGAEKSIDRLTASLSGLNTSLKKIGNNAGAVRNVVKSLSMLSTIKIPSLSKMVNQLEKLGMIDFSNLDKLKLDINLSGLSDAEKKAIAVRNTLESFKPQAKEVSKQLQQAFSLDSNATAQVRNAINQYYKAVAEGGDKAQRTDILTGLQQTIINAGSVARTTVDSTYSYLNEKQKEFLQEFGGGKKLFIPSDQLANAFGLHAGDAGKRLGENLQYVVTDAMKGIKIDDSAWSEIIDNYGNGRLFGSGELENLHETADRVTVIINKLKELKDVSSQRIALSEAITSPDTDTWQAASNAVSESVSKSIRGSKAEIEAAMQSQYEKFSMQIPLDISVDQARFENQIRAAIEQARHADYGKIDVDLKVSTEKLKNSVTQALSGGDVKDIQGLVGGLHDMVSAMREMSQIDVKSSGITTFVNALARLSKESANFNKEFAPTTFQQLSDGIKSLSGTEEIAKSFGTFINSINRFIGSSKNMQATVEVFPSLSSQIQSFFTSMSQTTISDNTVRMAEALAEISKSGRRAGAAMQSLGESARESGIQFSAFNKVTESIKFGFKSLLTLFKKFGSGAVSALKSVISKVKELGKTKDSVNTLHFSLKNLLTTLIGFHGIRGVFNWTKDAIKAGADLTEIDHIVESVYGNMSDSVKNWADNMIENYGIASSDAKRYAGTLTAMAQASGVTADKAAALGMNLTEAAGDLSAFFNIGTAESFQKIQSGLAGQVRPLRSLGIDLSVATLKEFALEQGITKSYTAMTQAEKVMLRYSYIMNVLRADTERGIGVLGDYSRTQYSFANSSRKLMAYLSAIKTQIGAGLAAAIRPAIVALNTLMARLLKAAQAFAAFMKTLFPFKNGASGLALGDAAAYTDDMADSADSAADGFGDADDAVKKLKKDLSVLPFDELNQLNKDRESATSGKGSGAGAVSGPIDFGLGEGLFDLAIDETKHELSELEEYVNDWAKRIKEAFDKKDWDGLGTAIATGINDGIEELYRILDPQVAADKINPFVDAVSTTLNSLITAIHWNTLGKTIGNGVNIIVNAANRLIDPETGINWTNIGTQFADGANGFVSQLDFDALGTLFANKFNIFWEVASGFVTKFDWESLGTQMSTGANGFIKKIDFHAIKVTFTDGINGITDATRQFIKDFKAEDFGTSIASLITGIVKDIHWQDIGTALSEIWNKAWSMLSSFISELGNSNGLTTEDALAEKLSIKNSKNLTYNISGGGTGIGEALTKALKGAIDNFKVDDLKTSINTLVQKVATDIAQVFGKTEMWYDLGHKIGDAIAGIFGNKDNAEKAANAFNAIVDGLGSLLGGAIDALTSKKKEIFDGIVKFLEDLDWGDIFNIVGFFAGLELIKALPAIIARCGLKEGLIGAVTSLFKETAAAEAVATSGGSIFASLKTALTGPAGILSAVVLVTDAVTDLTDAMRGGNGKKTVFGGAVDSFLNELQGLGGISEGVREKMFLLKEQVEDGKLSAEDFGIQLSKALTDGGVSAEEAQALIKSLGERIGGLNDDQISVLLGLIKSMPSTTNEAKDALEQLGIDGAQAYDDISQAIADYSADREGMNLVEGQMLRELLANYQSSGTGIKTALKGVIDKWVEMGGKPEQIKTAIERYMGPEARRILFDTGTTISNLATNLGMAKEKAEKFGSQMETSGKLASAATEKAKDYNETTEKAPSLLNTLSTLVGGLATTLITSLGSKTEYSEAMKGNVEGAGTSITDNESLVTDAMGTVVKDTLAQVTGASEDAKESGKSINDGVATGMTENSEVVKTAGKSMGENVLVGFTDYIETGSPSKLFTRESKPIPEGVGKGITDNISIVTAAIDQLCRDMKTEFNTKLNGENGLGSVLNTSGATLVSKIISGMNSKLSLLKDKADDVTDKIKDLKDDLVGMKSDFYNAGQDLAENFADGLASVSIPTPDIYVSSWTPWTVQTADQTISFDIPYFTAGWKRYAKGGFFNRPLAGILGEAGDEAAIPLENRHVMSRIADAIVDNSGGGLGVSKQDIVDAVVYAMAANANNQPPINVTATLYTEDNEVLARSVERGQRSRNMRFNPTTAY